MDKSHFVPLLPKNPCIRMSANSSTPLFMLSDGDDIEYEEDPAVAQAKANLMAAECIQQEKAEQRRLEREE